MTIVQKKILWTFQNLKLYRKPKMFKHDPTIDPRLLVLILGYSFAEERVATLIYHATGKAGFIELYTKSDNIAYSCLPCLELRK